VHKILQLKKLRTNAAASGVRASSGISSWAKVDSKFLSPPTHVLPVEQAVPASSIGAAHAVTVVNAPVWRKGLLSPPPPPTIQPIQIQSAPLAPPAQQQQPPPQAAGVQGGVGGGAGERGAGRAGAREGGYGHGEKISPLQRAQHALAVEKYKNALLREKEAEKEMKATAYRPDQTTQKAPTTPYHSQARGRPMPPPPQSYLPSAAPLPQAAAAAATTAPLPGAAVPAAAVAAPLASQFAKARPAGASWGTATPAVEAAAASHSAAGAAAGPPLVVAAAAPASAAASGAQGGSQDWTKPRAPGPLAVAVAVPAAAVPVGAGVQAGAGAGAGAGTGTGAGAGGTDASSAAAPAHSAGTSSQKVVSVVGVWEMC